MKKSFLKLSALSIALVMLLAACNGGGGSSSSTPAAESPASPSESAPADAGTDDDSTDAPAGGDETITILMGNTGSTDGILAVAAEIEAELGYKTDIELRPTGAEGENLVRTRLASGDSPDIHRFNAGSLFATLNPVENFIPLNDQPFMDRMQDSFIQTVTFDGVTYGIPSSSSTAGAWLYNKAIYAELGLEVPHTWDDLMANCEIIKEAGYTAVLASFATDWTSQLILLADYYNVHSNDPSFAGNFDTNQDKYATNQYAFKAFDHMAEVWEKGYMNADYNATTFDQALVMIAEGEAAHYPMLTHAISNIVINQGIDKANGLGAFGQPGDNADDHGLTVWMPDAFYFYKGTEHEDAVMAWAAYFLREESVEVYASAQTADGPYVTVGASLPDDTPDPVKDLIHYFDEGKTSPALEFITSVKGPNSPQICIQAMSGLKSAEECAQEYDDDVEKQAKQLGLEGW